MTPDLSLQVRTFVADSTGVSVDQLSPGTTLFGDLAVDGADGYDLIEEFGRRFQVDLTEFRGDEHFGPEDFLIAAPLLWAWWIIRWPFRAKQTPEVRAGLRTIRVSDLIESAREGRWKTR